MMPDLFRVVSLVRSVRVFRGLGDGDLAAVARAAHYRELDAGLCLFHQGTQVDCIYALCHGSVKLLQSKPKGHEVLLRFVNAGQLLGPMTAVDRPDYAFTAVAVRWCQALGWNIGVMAELMETYPRIALNALAELTVRMRELQARYCELATERVEQRVAQGLIRLADQVGYQTDGAFLIDVPLSRHELAQMTGTSLYTVSRLLSAWEREGVVDAGRQRVAILERQRLAAIAEARAERRSATLSGSGNGAPLSWADERRTR